MILFISNRVRGSSGGALTPNWVAPRVPSLSDLIPFSQTRRQDSLQLLFLPDHHPSRNSTKTGTTLPHAANLRVNPPTLPHAANLRSGLPFELPHAANLRYDYPMLPHAANLHSFTRLPHAANLPRSLNCLMRRICLASLDCLMRRICPGSWWPIVFFQTSKTKIY